MNYSLEIANLEGLYRSGELTPARMVDDVLAHIETTRDSNAWIHVLSRAELEAYLSQLNTLSRELPLWGIPFAIKDNIDLANVPTTAACPGYSYVPGQSAVVVQKLVEAGAIPIGKTNLDQFATGLVGTRSPYGPGRNAFDPAYISGGSSAGSAIAVANGSVSFALGTDTAGSGRVPAAFNNLVGLKPSKGLLSTTGVVPACRSLDCVSIFGLTADDAERVLSVAEGFDREDPFSRQRERSPRVPSTGFRFGVPHSEQLQFFGNTEAEALFRDAVRRCEALGGEAVEIDLAPFLDAARLLYDGPWLAERYVAIRDFLEARPDELFPVTRQIIEKGRLPTAADAFMAHYRLAELKRVADTVWSQVHCIITPTAGTIYTIADVAADPVTLNSNLGYYTNFMNLLDYSAVAVPAGFQSNGLPFGVTLFAPAFAERDLLSVSARLQQGLGVTLGATAFAASPQNVRNTPAHSDGVRLLVVGAHLSGMPLNHQLTERGGVLLKSVTTAPLYRLFALSGEVPRPGMVRVTEAGAVIEGELWELSTEAFGAFVAEIPEPLGIGTVELEDGALSKGFLCESYATHGASDITSVGGWRRYLSLISH